MRGTLPDLHKLVTALQSHAQTIGDECALRIAAHAPVGKGPTAGRLKEDIHATVSPFDLGLHIRVESGVPEAAYVLQGTAPHEIEPRTRRALFWPEADHPVRRVHHPGTKPNPFPEEARADIEQVIRDEWQSIFAEAHQS